ncbi:endonuclease III [Candidatus Gottesmanbacteria bacterium]|nr:endonuclease III [Candidatus Gottesmanbacteria bacterium]
MTKEEKVKEIIKRLKNEWPKPKVALNYSNPLELLVATILSAQATDKLVNQVTPALFQKYKKARDYADAPLEKLDNDVRKVNFHFSKAKNIKVAAKIIDEKYNGKVPDTMEELDSLPGVARKTANVVLGVAFTKSEGIVVDTHVIRLSQRLGLTSQNSPEKIELDLMKIVPKQNWIDFPLLLINYGRTYCPARPHQCPDCPLGNLCPDKKE